MGRRQVLRGLVVVGGTLALVGPAGLRWAQRSRAAGATVPVYRFSTRGQPACGACKGHAAHRSYATAEAAGADRAHAGCNCTILVQHVSADARQSRFGGTWGPARSVFDDRRDLAYQPPPPPPAPVTTPPTVAPVGVGVLGADVEQQGGAAVATVDTLPRTT